MLGHWTPRKHYVQFVISELRKLARTHPEQIREDYLAICKMLLFDLDPMKAEVEPSFRLPSSGNCIQTSG